VGRGRSARSLDSARALGAGALVAMIVEILPIPVDDNFASLLAGVVLQWLR
jgi:hypothetical protein